MKSTFFLKSTMAVVLVTALLLVVSNQIMAGNTYRTAMKAGIDSLQVNHRPDYIAVANHFDRIANNNPEEWLPGYYSAYCRIIMAFSAPQPNKKEVLLNQAKLNLDKAMDIAPNEPEVITLKGLYYQAMIGLDPQNTAQMYSGKAEGAFQRALKIDPNNPRASYLSALNVYFTPAQFGGGAEKACPLFKKSMALFNEFQAKSDLHPVWGKRDLANYIKKCK